VLFRVLSWLKPFLPTFPILYALCVFCGFSSRLRVRYFAANYVPPECRTNFLPNFLPNFLRFLLNFFPFSTELSSELPTIVCVQAGWIRVAWCSLVTGAFFLGMLVRGSGGARFPQVFHRLNEGATEASGVGGFGGGFGFGGHGRSGGRVAGGGGWRVSRCLARKG
jgi:hypothetical protein